MGGDHDQAKTVKILNHTLTWTKEGVRMEADPRHVEEVIKSLGLEAAKTAATPCAASRDEEKNQEAGGDQKCVSEDVTTRACSAMSLPAAKDWKALKRIGKYLKGKPRAGVL
eukprot:14180318-Heterocapsa_arctica.AAC.1